MRTRRSRSAAYAGSAVLVAAIIGCGDLVNHDDTRPVRHVSIAAIYLDDGYPTVLMAPCKATRAYRFAISDGVKEMWSVLDNGQPNPVTTIRFFVQPRGWETEVPGGDTMRAMSNGTEYLVFVDLITDMNSRTNDDAITFQVALADLTSLRPGEVWAVPAPNAKATAMTRAQFHARSTEMCTS